MRTSLHWVVVLMFLITPASAVMAAESAPAKTVTLETEKKAAEKKPAQKKPKTGSATKATKPLKLTGEITAVDIKAGTVSVKGASGEKSFTTQDAAKDTLEIVKVGERVRVSYSEKNGKLVTASMKRMKPKSARSGTKEKKSTKAPAPQTKDGGESNRP